MGAKGVMLSIVLIPGVPKYLGTFQSSRDHAFQQKNTCMLMYSLSMRKRVVMTIVHTRSHDPEQACGQLGFSGKVAMTNCARALPEADRRIACHVPGKRPSVWRILHSQVAMKRG